MHIVLDCCLFDDETSLSLQLQQLEVHFFNLLFTSGN